MEYKYIFLIVIAVVIAVAVIVSLSSAGKKKGRAAERKVSAELHRIGRKKHNCKIMNNAFLPLYNGTCEIDHLMFTPCGIFVVETKGISGTVSGNGKNLVHRIGNKTYNLYNPALQNQTHVDNVVHHLKKGGFNNVPVRGIVVFSADDIQLETNVGIYLRDLNNYIMKFSGGNCNAKELYSYFNSIRVRNPFKKMIHNFKTGRKNSQ
jgi:ABC-type antimicrobial peptide transport system permease subunit